MALKPCLDCGHQNSDTALTCPSCGRRLRSGRGGCLVAVGFLVLFEAAVLVAAWFWVLRDLPKTLNDQLQDLRKGFDRPPAAQPLDQQLQDLRKTLEMPSTAQPLNQQLRDLRKTLEMPPPSRPLNQPIQDLRKALEIPPMPKPLNSNDGSRNDARP